MPTYKYHLVAGAATFGLMAWLTQDWSMSDHLQTHHYLFLCGITLLGALFPDVDVQSRMQKLFFWTTLFLVLPLCLWMEQYKIFWIWGAVCVVLLLIPHRSLTHRAWFLVLAPSLGSCVLAAQHPTRSMIIFSACIYFIAGALSHLLLDYRAKWFFWRKKTYPK